MRCRYYHLPIDTSPVFGSVTGFGRYDAEMEWLQPSDWWQVMLIAFGGVLTVNGVPAPFEPGSLLIVPPSARCRIDRTSGPALSQYWLKFRPAKEGQLTVALPQIRALGGEFAFHEAQFRSALDFLPMSRVRTDVMGWNLLWTVAENAATVPEDPLVDQAERMIKADLSRQMSAESLADELSVSVAHLTRVFREHFGQPPAEYIRTLRMQQACILLVNTDRPIKEIAVRLGFTDLQRFNKVVRDTFGCSPRALRYQRSDHAVYASTADEAHQQACLEEAEPPKHLNGSNRPPIRKRAAAKADPAS